MMLGIGIKVPVLDKTFYECIPQIKATFKKMYPHAELCFDVIADTLVDCSYKPQATPSVFFTGGVDATSALIEEIEQKPLLINIWGGDSQLTDLDTHTQLESYISSLTERIGTQYAFVKSNCRWFFNEAMTTKRFGQILNKDHIHGGWWAGIAHILTMTSTIAPLLYLTKTGVHYIGSSNSHTDALDANNEDMIKAIRYASCTLSMVENDKDRIFKIGKITRYCSAHHLPIELKVCWYSHSSHNCSHCEKCYRTILNIICNHGNPNDFGFDFDKDGYRRLHNFAKYTEVPQEYWDDNQKAFQEQADYWRKDKNMAWILDITFNDPKRLARVRQYKRLLAFIKSTDKVKIILNKFKRLLH